MKTKPRTRIIGLCFKSMKTKIMVVQKVKKMQSPSPATWAHRAAMISVSIALSQTPAYAARPQIQG